MLLKSTEPLYAHGPLLFILSLPYKKKCPYDIHGLVEKEVTAQDRNGRDGTRIVCIQGT